MHELRGLENLNRQLMERLERLCKELAEARGRNGGSSHSVMRRWLG